MKCDELRVENACVYGPGAKVYLVEKVDAILAKKDKEIAELKAQKAQALDDCAFWKNLAQKRNLTQPHNSAKEKQNGNGRNQARPPHDQVHQGS